MKMYNIRYQPESYSFSVKAKNRMDALLEHMKSKRCNPDDFTFVKDGRLFIIARRKNNPASYWVCSLAK